MFCNFIIYVSSIAYVVFCVIYVLPPLQRKRGLVCNFMASMFDKGIFQRSSLGHICLGISYVSPRNSELSQVSSLNFVYEKYYKEGSTGPKRIYEPEKSWKSGPPTLVNHINKNFSAIQHNIKNIPPLIYQRRGYRGIPTQIFCTCDIILLGILLDRPVQIIAPNLPDHFFSFPLYNITYPVDISPATEYVRLNHHADISGEVDNTIIWYPRKEIDGVTNNEPLSPSLSGSVLLILSNMVGRRVVRNRALRNRYLSLMELPRPIIDDWYSACVPSVFQPSVFTQRFLDPYLKKIEGRYTIGVHIRYDESKSDSESSSGLKNIMEKFSMIHELQQQKDAIIVCATDSEVIRKLVRDNFENDLIMVDYLPIDETGKEATEATSMRVLIELFLLGASDSLFLTEKSKFSMVGLYLNNKSPSVVYFCYFCLKNEFMPWTVEDEAGKVFKQSYGEEDPFCVALSASIHELSSSGVEIIHTERFVALFCTFVRDYLDATCSLLGTISFGLDRSVCTLPRFLFCVLRRGKLYFQNDNIVIYTPFSLPFESSTSVPVVFILEQQNPFSSSVKPFVFHTLDKNCLSCCLYGVVTRKALTLLCDGSYVISLSKEGKRGDVPILLNGDHAAYCCYYLHVGDSIICSDCLRTDTGIKLDFSSTILIQKQSVTPKESSAFTTLPTASPFFAFVNEGKKLGYFRGKIVHRENSTNFLLEGCIIVISACPLPFNQGDEIQLYNVHMIPARSAELWRVICMCITSSFSILNHHTLKEEPFPIAPFPSDSNQPHFDTYHDYVHHSNNCSFLTQVLHWVRSLPYSWDDYRMRCVPLYSKSYRISSFLGNDYPDSCSHLIPGNPLLQSLVCYVYLRNSVLVARIGSTVIPCVCETCFQTMALRVGQVIRVVLNNTNAQFFISKRIKNQSFSVAYLLLLHSLVAEEQPGSLIARSLPSLQSRKDNSLIYRILSGLEPLSMQNVDVFTNNLRSIPPLKERVAIQFTVLHRVLSCRIFVSHYSKQRVTLLHQSYECFSSGIVVNIHRTEFVVPPVRAVYSLILQEEGKLLPGAMYCVENAAVEDDRIVIDNNSHLHCLSPPSIPAQITLFSVSQTIRMKQQHPIWMVGTLIDCMFTLSNGDCIVRIQDCWSHEIIQFHCGDYVERYRLGDVLVFTDIERTRKGVSYTQNSSCFRIDSVPDYLEYSWTTVPMESFSFTWQSVDVIAVHSVNAYSICPLCETVLVGNDHNCCSDEKPIILLSITFIAVINDYQLFGRIYGDDAVRWLNLSPDMIKRIESYVFQHEIWKNEKETIVKPAHVRRLLGRVKLLCKRTSFNHFIALEAVPENPQFILEQLLRE